MRARLSPSDESIESLTALMELNPIMLAPMPLSAQRSPPYQKVIKSCALRFKSGRWGPEMNGEGKD
jgi:hypothetical protein